MVAVHVLGVGMVGSWLRAERRWSWGGVEVSSRLNRQVDPLEVVWIFVIGVALVSLFAVPEHRDAGIAVLATTIFWDLRNAAMRRRAARRHQPPSPGPVSGYSLRETAYLPFSPAAVWAVLHPADLAPLLNPNIVKGYRVPGTPDGVGEQQAFVDVAGGTTVIEVVDGTPGERSATRQVSPKATLPTLSTWEVQPASDGCIVSFQQEMTVSAVSRPDPAAENRWREGIRDMFRRLRDTLQSQASSDEVSGG
jgi:hypothetical protein